MLGLFGAAKEIAQAAASSPAVNRQQRAGAALTQGDVATKAKTGAAVGAWGLFAALVLPLGFGIGGAVLAVGRERKAEGRERKNVVSQERGERRGTIVDRRGHRDDHLQPTDPSGRPIPAV